MSPSYSPHVRMVESLLHPTLAIHLHPLLPVSFAVKHLVISSGQLQIQVSYHPSTNSPFPLQTPPISPSSKSPNPTLTQLSGACSTSPMLVIIYPQSALSLERYRRTLQAPMAVVLELVLLGKQPRKRPSGRPWERETRTVSNGSFSAPH